MLTFKNNTAHRYFIDILHKSNKEPIGLMNQNEITNVVVSYDIYKKLSHNYRKALRMLCLTDKDLEEYFKFEIEDEALDQQDIIG